jgi:hypothetical protein
MDPSTQGPPPGAVATPLISGPPPGAVATPLASPSAVQTPSLSDNPNNEGTYQMQGPKGDSIQVPYSKVGTDARQAGYQLVGGKTWYGAPTGDAGRFARDYASDPKQLAATTDTAKAVQDPGQGLEIGAARGAALTASGLAHIARKATGTTGSETGAEKGAKEFGEGGDTGAEEAGKFIESASEFLMGDEALQGLSYVDKVKKVLPALKVLEKSPILAKAVDAAIQQGTVGTVQAAAHGASPTEALTTGALTGATGGTLRAAGEGVGAALDSRAANAAAESDRAAAQTAYENVKPVTEQRTQAMVANRQAAAQQGVKDVVKDSAQRMANRVNEAMQPPLGVTGYPVEGADFQPIDTQALAQRVNSFGDLAQETRDAVTPIANKLDEASGGQLSKLQADRAAAFKAGDREAADQADSKINDLVAANRDVVTPEQYKAFRSSYSDSKVLDDLHRATESSFNGLSEDLAAQPGTGTRKLRGTPYQNALGKFLQNNGDTRIEKIIGPDGLANLHRAANLVSTPELKSATQKLAAEVAAEFPKPAAPAKPTMNETVKKITSQMATGAGVGALVSHATGLPHFVTEPIGAAAAAPARYVLQKMVTSPRIGQMMDYAVRNNVTPKLAAGLIAAEIQKQDAQGQASQNPPQ